MKEKPLTAFMNPKKAAKENKEKPEEPKVAGLEGPWELPEGWRWVRLDELFTVQQGVSLSPKRRKGKNPLPFLRTKNVRWGYVDLSELDYMDFTPEEVEKLNLKPGDLLVLEGGEIGRTAIWRGELKVCFYQNHIHRLRRKRKDVVPEFYMYWMQAAYKVFNNYSQEGVRTAIPNLSKSRLAAFKVPFPPLNEQKRIVAKLDEISKRLEDAKKLAREVREEAEKLMASALHEVFSKAEEQGWKWVRLGDAVTRRNETIDPTQNPDLPFVGLEHITPGEVKLSKYSYTVDLKSQKYVFYPGDVLYGKLRPYLDKAVVATIKGMCSTDLLVLTPKEGVMPEYLVTFMHTPQFRELATQYMRGTNHPRISWKSLQKFKIPLPPLEEQKRIVAYLDRISERAQKLVKLYEEREKELEQLFPAILDRAFRGEL